MYVSYTIPYIRLYACTSSIHTLYRPHNDKRQYEIMINHFHLNVKQNVVAVTNGRAPVTNKNRKQQ